MAGKEAVGKLIREARLRKEWSQEKVAEQMRQRHGLNTTGNYVGKLEHAWAVPSRATMEALSDVLDIPLGRLFEAAGMLEGVMRPRADEEGGDWLDEAVEALRDDPQFAETYRLLLERDDPPEVRREMLEKAVQLWRDSLALLVIGRQRRA